MNVLLLPGDQFGCGYYRMRLPQRYSGVACDVETRLKFVHDGQKVLSPGVEGADVVVFQRPMDWRMPALIAALQRKGVAVVVELDDDLASLDPHHISFRAMHPTTNPLGNWQILKRCCRLADIVTVSTVSLAERYAAPGKAIVIENFIEERLLSWVPEPSLDFGWTGIVPSHPHDLQVLGTSVRDLIEEGYDFGVVGDGLGVPEALGLDHAPDATGWLPLDDYYRAASRFRVGLVPLADTVFNRGKSWLKGLEFAALGVPFVASATDEYAELQNHGAGLLASRPRSWKRYVAMYLDDEANRIEQAEHARDGVRSNLTIEKQGWRWAEAWETALVNRHRKGRTAA